ncbi:MAG: cytochrome c oxidase cbb3-type subunit 2 [Planctomycetota bacterium]|jgi:cytochrome c oxidase cbb3-type subunit 2
MERFYTLTFVAGIGCFALAFVLSIVFPVMSLSNYHGMEYQTMEQLAETPSQSFVELSTSYPESFKEAFGSVSSETYADALATGRDIYIGQACWHCHSQYVRVVSNEEQRFGPPSTAQEYNNALNQPHLWGTRRVGPDLTREYGKRTNDWHIAHLINPKNVVPNSVMPAYGYYFNEDGSPKKDGFSLVTYLQWIGSTYKGDPQP